VRKSLAILGVIGMLVPSVMHAQGGAPQPGVEGTGVFGPLGALGQESAKPRPAQTGPAPRLPDGTVDLTGVWVGGGPVNDIAQGLPKGEKLPLLPASVKLMEYRAQHETDDPHLWCAPMGVPRTTPYPFRFVQNFTHKAPTHIFLLHEATLHTYRQIFMDGRTHPAELDPTWFGHSIGHFEGKDTLVIDTVGYNDKFWFDRKGTPHTEQLHTIERWSRPNVGTLINAVTIDDPGAFSKPFTVTFTAKLSDPKDELMEYFCSENNQYGIAGAHENPLQK
jgi:hypothetical protein